MTKAPLPPLVVVGPTASGKSALALELAVGLRADGVETELISADAMAVYRGMDVGTAKPTRAEQTLVPHHLIDVVGPDEEYTVSRFSVEVERVLADLDNRAVVPILVGGTGLYVRAVIDEFTIPPMFPAVLADLESEPDTEALFERLAQLDPVAATKMLPTNRRRILRALEVTVGSGQQFSSFGPGVDRYPETQFRQVGIEIDRAEMDLRIDRRYDQQMADGFLDEARTLAQASISRTAGNALGYKELFSYLNGEASLEEALDLAKRRTRRFARRQQRWFKRDPRVEWVQTADGSEQANTVALVRKQWELSTKV